MKMNNCNLSWSRFGSGGYLIIENKKGNFTEIVIEVKDIKKLETLRKDQEGEKQ